MDTEASSFESSEMVASLLASTPLLRESWRVCSVANAATVPGSFVSEQIGDVGYFAFSGVQITSSSKALAAAAAAAAAAADPEIYGHAANTKKLSSSEETDHCRKLVALDSAANGLFSPLTHNNHNYYRNRSCNDAGSGQEEQEPTVMVNEGLLNLFLSLHTSPTFRNQMSALIEKSKSIVITGHSLGGTVASLCTLWLLSYLQSISSTLSVLCITFGSPLLGNESLSRAILRERWGGNFCHVVSKYDIMPRLLFAPLASCTTQLHILQQYWHVSMASDPYDFESKLPVQLGDKEKAELFSFISEHLRVSSQAGEETASSLYWPFGNYLFCSQEGAICVENAASVIKMMYLMFITGNPTCCIEDHLKYGDYVGNVSSQFLNNRSFMQGDYFPESSYDAGVALALQSSGISGQESAATAAKECLKIARRLGRTPSLNSANLAILLSKITPYRAQIEWYKACCDKCDEQLGYYDSFKLKGSRRDYRVNLNRYKLAAFWDDVIDMLENNRLPRDFDRRAKWVNASQFYKLLVEPLDIAEYYRSGMHRLKGHYLKHGRARRFEIFDRWWRERQVSQGEQNNKRSKFAGLTQDSCFWARVEEARELLADVRRESDARKLRLMWDNIHDFERYASILVESKQVSQDVLAKNSSYTLWVEELTVLKSQVHQIHPQLPSLRNGELVP